jgi:hypothetical protein
VNRIHVALLSLLVGVAVHAQQFRAEAIKAHVTFLASDLLEGRGTGTRGYQIAAEYVAAQYALAGLEPGANGSWYQSVPFLHTVASPQSTVMLTRTGGEPMTVRIHEGFTAYGDPLRADTSIDGEVVFAGYGITAPDQKYDDYAGVDVRGKVVALFGSAPKSFPNAVRAHHSATVSKMENAAAHGAAGVIFLSSPEDEGRFSWAQRVRQSKLGSMHWLQADGTPSGVRPALSSSVSLSLDATRRLLGADANAVFSSVAEGNPRSRVLPVRAKIRLRSAHERSSSPNVVGLLRGSDPVLRDEYLVYTAHLDHLGISEPVNGDAINNGAFDNASGIAVMLEVARAFASQPRPRRSILFVATTAEEKGSRGADYFVQNPPVPESALIGNINIDMLVMISRTRDLVPIGVETNELGDAARQVAREMKIELSPDPFPEEVVFVRSDQYPFVRRGVPALYVGPGYVPEDPAANASRGYLEWLRTRYHTPTDDLAQPIDWSAALLLTEFDYRLGLAVANADARPRWKPGDFFGETFARR